MKSITIGGKEITCCAECTENTEYPNPLWSKLPPSHYCRGKFNPLDKKGKPIMMPGIIPTWCPYASD